MDGKENYLALSTSSSEGSDDGSDDLHAASSSTRVQESSVIAVWISSTAVALCVVVITLQLWLSRAQLFSPPPIYSCPSPTTPRPPSLLPSSDLSSPITLPSASSSSPFNVTLSHDKNVCNAFHLDFTRRDPSVCNRALATVAAFDASLDREIKERMGPDTIRIQVDGAERRSVQVPDSFDHHSCSYRYTFRLANAGRVWVSATLFFEDYNGFKDIEAAVRVPMHKGRPETNQVRIPLLAESIELDICRDSCPTFHAPQLGPPLAVYPLQPSTPLPICNSTSTPNGAYVPSSQIDQVYPKYDLPMADDSSRATAGLYTWVPEGCRFDHAGLRFRDHSACTNNARSLLLIGDSHTRALYDGATNRLSGHDTIAQSSPKTLSETKKIGKLGITFKWDAFLEDKEDVTCAELARYSSVALSSGFHLLSSDCAPLSTFIADLSRTFARWRACGNPQTLIYLTIPISLPPHKKKKKADCRTGPRTVRWNEAARALAVEHGWEVVDVEKYTSAVSPDIALIDGIHYLKTDAMAPILDDLIGRTGICTVDEL